MKRITNLVLVLCFVLVSALSQAQNAAPAATDAKPKLEIPQAIFDAGSVYRSQDKLEHAFIIKNTGTAELKILSAKPG